MSGGPSDNRPPALDRKRRQLVESVSGTVMAIALTLAAEVGDHWLPDLRSAGDLGACEAALSYRLGSPTPFEGFAWPRISGAMIDFLRRERLKLPPGLVAALEKAAAALEASADYVAELRDKGEDDIEEESAGVAAVVAVGLLCLGAGTPDPETHLLREERRAHLRRAMGLLSERDREIVTLRCFEGHTFKELAAHFGIHEDSARTRHKAAMKRLGAILRPFLLGSPGPAVRGSASCGTISAMWAVPGDR